MSAQATIRIAFYASDIDLHNRVNGIVDEHVLVTGMSKNAALKTAISLGARALSLTENQQHPDASGTIQAIAALGKINAGLRDDIAALREQNNQLLEEVAALRQMIASSGGGAAAPVLDTRELREMIHAIGVAVTMDLPAMIASSASGKPNRVTTNEQGQRVLKRSETHNPALEALVDAELSNDNW